MSKLKGRSASIPLPTWSTLLLAKLIVLIVKLWLKTLSYQADGVPFRHGPGVITFLHGEQLPLLCHKPKEILVAPISLSRDGTLQTEVMRHFGVDAIRGSSSRGGVHALRGLSRALNKDHKLLIAIDGPRGPYGELKPGAAYLANRHRVPLWFCHVRCTRAIQLKTWDRFMIPMPFAKITVTTHVFDKHLDVSGTHAYGLTELSTELGTTISKHSKYN